MRARSASKAERLEKSRALQAVLYRRAKQASAGASATGLRMPGGEREL